MSIYARWLIVVGAVNIGWTISDILRGRPDAYLVDAGLSLLIVAAFWWATRAKVASR